MPSRSLLDVIPALHSRWRALEDAFYRVFPKWETRVVCTHRPPEEQFELFKRGREEDQNGKWVIVDAKKVVTYKDGFKLKSRHNEDPAEALDIELFDPNGKKIRDNDNSAWIWLRDHAKDFGLFNGGNWSSLKDFPHFQLA